MGTAAAVALVAIGGCGSSPPAKGTFVGKLDGTNALVGIVSDSSRVRFPLSHAGNPTVNARLLLEYE